MAAFVLLQHVPYEGPGRIAEAARASGLTLDRRRLWEGEPVPDVTELAGLIVLGGPMGVDDTHSHPHLAAEIELLRTCADRALPVLGVCLGAQLLARALGASVAPGPTEEVGIGTVSLTAEGESDAVLGPAGRSLAVFHWHRDTFELPRGATHLAKSEEYPNQAFRAGRSYGLQFHVELDEPLAAAVRPHLPTGVSVGSNDVERVAESGSGVLDRFFRQTRDLPA